MNAKIEWIGVDWRPNKLRVWAMDAADRVVETRESDGGRGALARADFEPALLSLIRDWLPTSGRMPLLACGTIGGQGGWAEATLVKAPSIPLGTAKAVSAKAIDPRLDIRVLPGVRQVRPADMMRGEETQIGGFLSENPEFDGIVCLPGTHSKWVHISAREIVSFRTFMTGGLFAHLSESPVLRPAVDTGDWDEAAFQMAVEDAMSAPHRITARLFSLAAEAHLHGTDPADSRARLSGLLIGMEIAGAREYWLGREVVLAGAPELTALYSSVLARQGVDAQERDGTDLALAGLIAARNSNNS